MSSPVPPPPPPPIGGGFAPPPPPPPIGGSSAAGTNGLAVASLVCSLVGICSCLTLVLGVIFGFLALSQIKRTGQAGAGMAKAGVIIGICMTVLWIAYLIAALVAGASTNSY